MPDCGVTEFLRSGMIAEAHVTASNVTESRITSSEISGCHLQHTASVDEDSAQTIADAIAKLPQGMLVELAKAVAAAMPKAPLANEPEISTEDSLPNAVAGGRDTLLGKPDAWLGYQDFIVPAYKEGK